MEKKDCPGLRRVCIVRTVKAPMSSIGRWVCAILCALGLRAAALGESIQSGETVADCVATPRATNTYAFEAGGGERVKIRMTEVDPVIAPYLRLFNPLGKCFAYADSDCCAYRAAQINLPLPMAGRYTIACSDRNGFTGRYTVAMARLTDALLCEADRDIGPVRQGQEIGGVISRPGDLDVAVLTARAGDRAQIRMTGKDATLSPGLQLYAPDGACLAMSDGRPSKAAEITAVFQTSGAFVVLCQDHYVQTGRYSLAIGVPVR